MRDHVPAGLVQGQSPIVQRYMTRQKQGALCGPSRDDGVLRVSTRGRSAMPV